MAKKGLHMFLVPLYTDTNVKQPRNTLQESPKASS